MHIPDRTPETVGGSQDRRHLANVLPKYFGGSLGSSDPSHPGVHLEKYQQMEFLHSIDVQGYLCLIITSQEISREKYILMFLGVPAIGFRSVQLTQFVSSQSGNWTFICILEKECC